MNDVFGMFGAEVPAPKVKSPLVDGTPVEKVEGWERVWVKREDMSAPLPGPSFSKIRGVYAHLSTRPEKLIGVLDTYHSKAGWAVAYICDLLGKECVDFYPRYKDDGDTLREQQQRAADFGSELFPLPAGRSAILFHRARKEIEKRGGYMMPNALKLHETVEECANEVGRTPGLDDFDHIVISISSATIATGVLKGFHQKGFSPRVWLHMGYERSQEQIRRYMLKHHPSGFPFDITFINEGYGYKDQARLGDYREPPFPCNPYYDLKAWRWLDREGLNSMPGRVLFWNIGS